MALHSCYFNTDYQICARRGPPVRLYKSRMSIIECNDTLNGGLEDYNNISDRILPHFSTPFYESRLKLSRLKSSGLHSPRGH